MADQKIGFAALGLNHNHSYGQPRLAIKAQLLAQWVDLPPAPTNQGGDEAHGTMP